LRIVLLSSDQRRAGCRLTIIQIALSIVQAHFYACIALTNSTILQANYLSIFNSTAPLTEQNAWFSPVASSIVFYALPTSPDRAPMRDPWMDSLKVCGHKSPRAGFITAVPEGFASKPYACRYSAFPQLASRLGEGKDLTRLHDVLEAFLWSVRES
jgi:hypothetical protein